MPALEFNMSIYLEKLEERVKTTIMLLQKLKVRENRLLDKIYIYKCDYWSSKDIPSLDHFELFINGDVWAKEEDAHVWFYFQVKIDSVAEGCRNSIFIDLTPCWDPVRPQGLVYVNGEIDDYFMKVINRVCKPNNKLTLYETKLDGEKYQINFEKIEFPEFLQKR